jgi:hypothetical protein
MKGLDILRIATMEGVHSHTGLTAMRRDLTATITDLKMLGQGMVTIPTELVIREQHPSLTSTTIQEYILYQETSSHTKL